MSETAWTEEVDVAAECPGSLQGEARILLLQLSDAFYFRPVKISLTKRVLYVLGSLYVPDGLTSGGDSGSSLLVVVVAHLRIGVHAAIYNG